MNCANLFLSLQTQQLVANYKVGVEKFIPKLMGLLQAMEELRALMLHICTFKT